MSASAAVFSSGRAAEIDPVSLRGHWKASLSIGVVSFATSEDDVSHIK
jgi:hypothetical protein